MLKIIFGLSFLATLIAVLYWLREQELIPEVVDAFESVPEKDATTSETGGEKFPYPELLYNELVSDETLLNYENAGATDLGEEGNYIW
jgi:hypothetical protein